MSMGVFGNVFTYAFVSLFSIVNPVGMSGVFLELTKRFSNKRRHIAAYLVAIYGTILLLATFFLSISHVCLSGSNAVIRASG